MTSAGCDQFWDVDPLPVPEAPRPTQGKPDAFWWRCRSKATLERRS